MDRWFRPGQRILEINCGTGADAMFLAERGMRVEACDASPKMIEVAQRRREESPFAPLVSFRVLPIEQIAQLKLPDTCDGLLSNFAGLNCVEDLHETAQNLAPHVRPGSKALLCFFGPSCAWEMLWYGMRADIKRAFRRLHGGSRVANLAPGREVTVHYPTVESIRRDFRPYFRLVSWKGVGITVPPTYLEPWAVRFPRALAAAACFDAWLGPVPGFRALADHMLLVLERVAACAS